MTFSFILARGRATCPQSQSSSKVPLGTMTLKLATSLGIYNSCLPLGRTAATYGPVLKMWISTICGTSERCQCTPGSRVAYLVPNKQHSLLTIYFLLPYEFLLLNSSLKTYYQLQQVLYKKNGPWLRPCCSRLTDPSPSVATSHDWWLRPQEHHFHWSSLALTQGHGVLRLIL
jgi:hypothetical protein